MYKTIGLTAIIAIAIVGFATPAAAQKSYIDYDRMVDMKSFKTYAWASTPSISIYDDNPLMHSRIKNAIEYYLGKGGMVENTDEPDLWVTYYGESDQDYQINTFNSGGYGYGPGWEWSSPWGGSAVGMTATTSIPQKAGTLVIDIWSAETMKIVWRGTMTATIPENPQKSHKKLDKGIEKMVAKWQKMYAENQAKGQ
jgi:Domain of unknown function (DUF4136)